MNKCIIEKLCVRLVIYQNLAFLLYTKTEWMIRGGRFVYLAFFSGFPKAFTNITPCLETFSHVGKQLPTYFVKSLSLCNSWSVQGKRGVEILAVLGCRKYRLHRGAIPPPSSQNILCHPGPPVAATITVVVIVKGKAIPLEAWTGPEGSRRLRLPDFKTIGTWGW